MSNKSGLFCNQEGNWWWCPLDTQIVKSLYPINCTVIWKRDEKHLRQVLFPGISLLTSFTAVVLDRLSEISDKFSQGTWISEMLKISKWLGKLLDCSADWLLTTLIQRVLEFNCIQCCINVQRESRMSLSWANGSLRCLWAKERFLTGIPNDVCGLLILR